MNRFMLPLALFFVLVGFLAVGLKLDPHEVPSPLVGKPAPGFQLSQLEAHDKTFSPKDMLGKVWLLNVWASWCVSCRQEHEVLVDYSRKAALPLVGLNYQEVRGDGEFDMKKMSASDEQRLGFQRANMWLAQHGNPYLLTAMDFDGRVGIDYGVYGVPESYLIDKAGTIRYKQIGPVTPEVLEEKILPLVRELAK
jgi:cytochrome c biogenesis protein CcmG, thiol:disulfide interchange protein DsbE